jgi:hypothetical protein
MILFVFFTTTKFVPTLLQPPILVKIADTHGDWDIKQTAGTLHCIFGKRLKSLHTHPVKTAEVLTYGSCGGSG